MSREKPGEERRDGEEGAGARPEEPDEETLEHVNGILSETRDELARAEGKAALLLAAIGVASGALLAALMGDKWSPFDLRNCIEWAWWIGAVCLVASAAHLAWVVFPRTKAEKPGDQAPSYFADFAGYKTPKALGEALRYRNRSEAYDRATQQLHVVSKIVLRKYELVKRAIVLLGIAAVLCLGTALLDATVP